MKQLLSYPNELQHLLHIRSECQAVREQALEESCDEARLIARDLMNQINVMYIRLKRNPLYQATPHQIAALTVSFDAAKKLAKYSAKSWFVAECYSAKLVKLAQDYLALMRSHSPQPLDPKSFH